jgi:predicted ATP-dependent endonuclease of OLD family
VTHLTSLRLAGWKSIRDAEIEFRPLNVLIGANGAGKSNLVSFFKLVTEMNDQPMAVRGARLTPTELRRMPRDRRQAMLAEAAALAEEDYRCDRELAGLEAFLEEEREMNQ